MDAIKIPLGILVLASLELFEPDLNGPVANEFDVFPADDFPFVTRVKFAVARGDVDDLRCVETDGLCDDSAPAFAESTVDDVKVRPGRTGGDYEGVWKPKAVDGSGERRHGVTQRCLDLS